MTQKHIAVTGTKGKTTITRLIQEIIRTDEKTVFGEFGMDGSFVNGSRVGNSFRPADEYFKKPEVSKCNFIVSEATSYVLETGVYENMSLDVGVFTGFEETEHTELYESPAEYLAAKKILFSRISGKGTAVVNRDSPHYDSIIEGYTGNLITYGKDETCDYRIMDPQTSLEGTSFTIDGPDGAHTVQTMMWGEFNIYNMTAAFISSVLLDIDNKKAISAIRQFPGIKGRSNTYHVIDTNSLVVIDYAHTPESLQYQLEFLKEGCGSRKLVCVFGCGGMKSEAKRPIMGMVASQLCDHVVLTNDNPRDEHPKKILMEILEGVQNLGSVEVYPDREEAIKRTLSGFHNSVILIAGKGAEVTMDVAGCEIPMCDTETFEKWVIQSGYGIRGYVDYID